MLHRVFGVGDLAVATVLAAFFLGLGGGSWLASRWSSRIERPALTYGVLESIVAVYAALSPWIVPAIGRAYVAVGADASLEVLSLWRLGLSLAVLVPPALLLGATLPVVARLGQGERWARTVTALYVSNTIGAVLGAGLTGLVLLPSLGTRASMWVAAGASLLAAAVAASTHWSVRREPVEAPPRASREDEAPRGSVAGMALATALAAGTGLSALAGEVLWTRLLRTVVHGTTQAFASMLACYLFGIAVGGLVARRLARTRAGPARALAFTQIGAALLTVLAMVALPHLVRLLPLWAGELSFVPHRPGTILGFSAMLLLPLATVLGMGLPLVWSLVDRIDPDAGRGSGRLLAANTMGGLSGALLAGFVLVPSIGVEASLFVVVFVHLGVAGLALRSAESDAAPVRRSLTLVGPLVLGALLLALRPSVHIPFLVRASENPVEAIVAGPDSSWREPVVFLREGRSATVTVQRRPGFLRLYNDTRPESGFGVGDPGFGPELAVLGSLPSLFAERTDRAMVIGLGGGHSARVVLAGGFEQVDVVELEEAIVEAARLMYAARGTPFPIDDPRVRLVVDDARNRLVLAEPGAYDAIVSQPSHPWLAGSSALYTREFFREVDRALSYGGVFALWVNLFRIEVRHIRAVLRTLTSVFPHVQGFIAEGSSLVLCASRAAPRWDARLEARLSPLRHFLEPWELHGRAGFAKALELDPQSAEALAQGGDLIVDDLPILEFQLAATPGRARVRPRDLDQALREVPWWSPAFAERWASGAPVDALVERIRAVIDRPLALERLELSLEHAGLSLHDRALVEGELAAARGDVAGALSAWDSGADPRSATRADALRLAEGMPERALRVARDRRVMPDAATPLLRAALQVHEPWALRVAGSVAERVDDPGDRELADLVRAELVEPCAAWRERADELEDLAREFGEVAFLAQGCAFDTADREAAARLGTLSVRARRATAFDAYELGERCRAGGNGGCALAMFRRAVRAYPSHSRAAAALAQLLARAGRRGEARRVLLTSLRATEGLSSSQRRLAMTASELGLDIGVELPTRRSAEDSPTAISPSAPDRTDD
jgi:spermidine synthase